MGFEHADLEKAIIEAVRNGVEGKDIGVAFSGGLDSGLVAAIAKDYAESVTLYTCGTAKSYDVTMARDLSKKLDLPWVHIPLTRGSVEGRVRGLMQATGTSDPFTVSYELQLFCVCMDSEEDTILTGQGADEYFMGCAKFVGQTDEEFAELRDASVERLVNVSVPCEIKMAAHYGKELVYPYMDRKVLECVAGMDPMSLKPADMDSRKAVLRMIATDLGHECIAARKKKSSQYGSGTTDLIRALAREREMMYNEYIACIYDDVMDGVPSKDRGSVINARIDPLVKIEAERIIEGSGSSPSEAVELLYRRIIEDGDLRSIRR
jgi:asparagine synthase (glutamine-hydrolysing)